MDETKAALAEGVRKILYGGGIASIGLYLRYVREDFDKLAEALNALPLDAALASPSESAPQPGTKQTREQP